jgi:hypothetical protein
MLIQCHVILEVRCWGMIRQLIIKHTFVSITVVPYGQLTGRRQVGHWRHFQRYLPVQSAATHCRSLSPQALTAFPTLSACPVRCHALQITVTPDNSSLESSTHYQSIFWTKPTSSDVRLCKIMLSATEPLNNPNNFDFTADIEDNGHWLSLIMSGMNSFKRRSTSKRCKQ